MGSGIDARRTAGYRGSTPTYQPPSNWVNGDGTPWKPGSGVMPRRADAPTTGGPVPLSTAQARGRAISQFTADSGRPTGGDELTAMDLAQMFMNRGADTTSSGGRSYGGGGGGTAAVDPAIKAAYLKMWQDAQNPGVNPYDAYEANLRQAYSNVPVNQRWDATGQAVQGATAAGSDRLAGILQELNSRAAQGRTDVSQAVSQGGAALQGIGNQAMQRAQGLAQGLTGGLGAFGAGAVQDTASSSLNNLAAAGQMYNQMLGNSYDAMAADRPVVYAGLGGDIREGMTRDQAALENAIAMQRAKETQANDLALAQAMGQSGLQRAQMEAQRQQEMNKLRLEMAQLGIEV